MINRSYIVCATPRSGSNLLCEALWLAGAGSPDEYLLPWCRAEAEPLNRPTLDQILQYGTVNGVFGLKIMWQQLESVATALSLATGVQDSNPFAALNAAFPHTRYIHIIRNDRVRQAVSWAKAIRNGQWENRATKSRAAGSSRGLLDDAPNSDGTDGSGSRLKNQSPPAYDRDLIEWCYRALLDYARGWTGSFAAAGLHPLRVEYEGLVAAYEGVAESMMDTSAYRSLIEECSRGSSYSANLMLSMSIGSNAFAASVRTSVTMESFESRSSSEETVGW